MPRDLVLAVFSLLGSLGVALLILFAQRHVDRQSEERSRKDRSRRTVLFPMLDVLRHWGQGTSGLDGCDASRFGQAAALLSDPDCTYAERSANQAVAAFREWYSKQELAERHASAVHDRNNGPLFQLLRATGGHDLYVLESAYVTALQRELGWVFDRDDPPAELIELARTAATLRRDAEANAAIARGALESALALPVR